MTEKKEKVPAAPDPTAPGGAEFDVDNASGEEFAKHIEILDRRAKVAGLTPTPLQAIAATQEYATEVQPAEPDPNDIRAVNDDGEVRYFNPTTWDLLGEKHAGWKQSVDKPADLK